MTVIIADRAVRTSTQEEIGVDCHNWQSGKQSCRLMMSRNGGPADAYQLQARNCKVELYIFKPAKNVFLTNFKRFSVAIEKIDLKLKTYRRFIAKFHLNRIFWILFQ